MSSQPVADPRTGCQSTTGGSIVLPPSSPAAAVPLAAGTPPLAPPYGAEPPDYAKWRFGYPPFSGRMFGSGR